VIGEFNAPAIERVAAQIKDEVVHPAFDCAGAPGTGNTGNHAHESISDIGSCVHNPYGRPATHGRRQPRRGPDIMDEGPGGPPSPHGRRPPPPPPSKAAHFRLEHGATALDIKCAEDEPVKGCADLTLQILDKLQALPKP
jgi:hypothetical protein